MTENEIKTILLNNSEEKLNVYLNIILDKCKDIDKESNFIAVIMVILVFLYYMTGFKQPESLQIGPLTISDLNAVKIFIPLVFAFLIFRYVVLSAHKAELHKIIKEYTIEYFNFEDPNQKDALYIDDFTRSILPFSLYGEIGKLSFKGKSKFGCFGAILLFPISAVAILPYVLEYIWIKPYVEKYNTLDFTEKSTIILAIWMLALSFYYFLQTIIISIKENRES
jgi:hypothetical protein